MRRFPASLLLVVLAGCFASIAQAKQAYQVLMVHAYSQEYPWTKSQHEGFVDEFSRHSSMPVRYSTEYLDTKRRQYDAAYAALYARYIEQKYQAYVPDVIYVSDDYGYVFARDHLLTLFAGVPVIFSGVNDYKVVEETASLPIRGVFEKKNITKNLDLIHEVDKKAMEILVIGDKSSTYRSIQSEIEQQLTIYPRVRVDFVVHDNIAKLTEDLQRRAQKYIFLTTIGEIRSPTGASMTPQSVVSEIVNAGDFVIFTMEDAYFFDGVVGGYVTDGRLQGQAAARLALAYQRDRNLQEVSNVTDSPNAYIFDQSELKKRGIVLSKDVRTAAVFHNIPLSFYAKNRNTIMTLLALTSVVSLVSFSLALFARFRKREQERKREEHRTDQIERYQNAMITWAGLSHENIDEAFKKATELSSDTLKVDRVSIWLYDEDRSRIECRQMYVHGEGHCSGGVLDKRDFPAYFAAVDTGRRLAIDDARNDPATRELAHSYLVKNDIYSMLDVPIFYDGSIIGVVCHEHVGNLRAWSANEQEFSSLIASDISLSLEVEKRKLIEKSLEHQAYHDSLTGLPNRALLLDRIEQAIRHARRNHSLLAVIFLDLDNFKQINDSFGHSVGDSVLVCISARLQEALREMDTVARLGGDEFTIVLSDLERTEDINEIASKLLDVIREQLPVGGRELFVSTSMGISVFPNDGNTPEILLRNADAAMYRAKEKGRNAFEFYKQDMTKAALAKVLMVASLNRALEQEEFEIYYQPQYDVQKMQLVGLEALLRWNHPELGLVTPDDFLPVAEESGLIVAIDRWVLRKGLQQIKAWHRAGVAVARLYLNLTMQQLDQADFLAFLTGLMEEIGAAGDLIGFEITEGQLMKDPERTVDILNKISQLDIKIAVDDFGTGYSSLAYLKKLPVDTLKVDKGFIRDVTVDADDASIVRSIIALGNGMRIDVLAEGVENAAQLEFLKEQGCTLVQGYYLAHPQPAARIPLMATYPLS